MARKNLLKDLMEQATSPPSGPAPEPGSDQPTATTPNASRVEPARPRYTGGAIGAVSQSIAELKARSVIEVDPFHIHAGGLNDRLDDDDADHAALVASIRDHGQQVPVLLRPHPEKPDHFQVVYGRRRVKAMRDLGVPIKALIRLLDDQELVVAQGQENAARKDLSFIEKANFARQMRDLDYDRHVICATLHVDKTVISRMLSVADALNPNLIEAIGAAPSVGRDRWLSLSRLIVETETSVSEATALINLAADGNSSDKRFNALFKALTRPAPAKPIEPTAKHNLTDAEGRIFGHAIRSTNKLVLTLSDTSGDGFDDWLLDNLTEIHRGWKSGQDE